MKHCAALGGGPGRGTGIIGCGLLQGTPLTAFKPYRVLEVERRRCPVQSTHFAGRAVGSAVFAGSAICEFRPGTQPRDASFGVLPSPSYLLLQRPWLLHGCYPRVREALHKTTII